MSPQWLEPSFGRDLELRGARRCYIGGSIPWGAAVPYRVPMADPAMFDDPGPPEPEPPHRVRRALTVLVLLALIISMVFLAFVSGRGIIVAR